MHVLLTATQLNNACYVSCGREVNKPYYYYYNYYCLDECT